MNRFITASLLLLSTPLFAAQWIDKSGNAIKDQDNIKSSKNFIAQLILTSNEDDLLKKWQTPSETVNVNTSETVERNKPISAFIVFGGCKTDSKGSCNLVGKFKVYQPDGKVYANLNESEVWSGKPVPPNRQIELSVAYLKITIENGEQLGKYTVESVVTDKNDNESVVLKNTFTAVEKK